ncbi:MAG TPA: hypothetical protein VGM88_18730 [Kofleriaceae bacterium]
MQFTTTPLGRSVPSTDWKSMRSDTIMKVLFGIGTSPFNPSNDPVEVADLMHVTGLARADVEALVRALESAGFVEVFSDKHGSAEAARINRRGMEWVSSQPLRVNASGPVG